MTSDCTIVTSEQHLYQTIVQFDETIVLPRKFATGNIHDYLFWYCPLVGILFEVLRIVIIVSLMDMCSQDGKTLKFCVVQGAHTWVVHMLYIDICNT